MVMANFSPFEFSNFTSPTGFPSWNLPVKVSKVKKWLTSVGVLYCTIIMRHIVDKFADVFVTLLCLKSPLAFLLPFFEIAFVDCSIFVDLSTMAVLFAVSPEAFVNVVSKLYKLAIRLLEMQNPFPWGFEV